MRFFMFSVVIWLLMWNPPCRAQHKLAQDKEVLALIDKIKAKLKQGFRSPKELRSEMEALQALEEKHRSGNSNLAAQIALLKAVIHIRVFKDNQAGRQILARIVKEYPQSPLKHQAQQYLRILIIQDQLKPGKLFPDFQKKDLQGAPLSVKQFRGKILLIDFWATWCGPCVGEMPNVLKIYQQYHAKGFEIIGISLDKQRERLVAFLKQHSIPWPQYFDGRGWSNALARRYGIQAIPSTFLLDREGKIIACNLRGEQLAQAVAQAINQGQVTPK